MDYFTDATTNKVLDCSKADYKKLKSLADKMDQDEELGPSGLMMDYEKLGTSGLLYIYGKEVFNPDVISSEFIKALGRLLKKNKLKTLAMGISYTASKHAPESHGGNLLIFYDCGYMDYQVCLRSGNHSIRTAVKAINKLLTKSPINTGLNESESEALVVLVEKLDWRGPELPEDNSYDV